MQCLPYAYGRVIRAFINMYMHDTNNRSTPEELAKRRSSEADDVLAKAHTSASKKASTSSTTTAELDVFKKALTTAGTKVCVIYSCI
jgi:hypothetical protein